MRWILLDVALVVLGLLLVGLVARSLWRRTKALGRAVTQAGERLGELTAQLEAASHAQATDRPRA